MRGRCEQEEYLLHKKRNSDTEIVEFLANAYPFPILLRHHQANTTKAP